MEQSLDSSAPVFFDVVDYATVERPEFREHIDRVGQSIYRRE